MTSPEQTENAQPDKITKTVHRRNPLRNKKKAAQMQEFETEDAVGKLPTVQILATEQNVRFLKRTKKLLYQTGQSSGKTLLKMG